MGHDGSGEINYTEFLAATAHEQAYLQEDTCKAAFHMLDTDHDGVISKSDLLRLFGTLGAPELEQMMSEVDSDGNGTLSFDEFMEMMHTTKMDDQMVKTLK